MMVNDFGCKGDVEGRSASLCIFVLLLRLTGCHVDGLNIEVGTKN